MKKLLRIILILVLLVSCQEKKEVDLEAEAEKLMATSREWAKSTTPEEYLSYWTADAVVMPTGQPSYVGSDQIMGMLEGEKDIPGFSLTWEPYAAKISDDGSMGYLLEKMKFQMNDSLGNPLTQFYRVLTVWEKDDSGEWKCVADMYNEDPSLTSLD